MSAESQYEKGSRMSTSSEYVVTYGSSAALGRFVAAAEQFYRRGDRVVIESRRGLELGVVLCPTTPRHARLLPDPAPGRLLRLATAADEAQARQLRALAHELFAEARRLAVEAGLPFEILDVELLLDGRRAIVQHLRGAECDHGPFAVALERARGIEVLLEDLALPPTAVAEEEHGGCGEPGCGRAEGASGCSSCGTGGGCSSCGGRVDMREYFAHLRTKMEQDRRVPLL